MGTKALNYLAYSEKSFLRLHFETHIQCGQGRTHCALQSPASLFQDTGFLIERWMQTASQGTRVGGREGARGTRCCSYLFDT